MSKAVKIFFTLSILLNLALGGVILGHVYRQFQDSEFGDVIGDISPETRQIMRQVYSDKHKEIWDMRADMRKKKRAIKTVILTEPFDVKAFNAAAKDVKKQNERAFDSRVDTFGKVLAKLPKPERSKMAQRTVDILVGERKWDRTKDKPKVEEGKNPFAPDAEDKEPEEGDKKKEKKKKD